MGRVAPRLAGIIFFLYRTAMGFVPVGFEEIARGP
jgi:hypothetical protein